jgi:hypothetical protein
VAGGCEETSLPCYRSQIQKALNSSLARFYSIGNGLIFLKLLKVPGISLHYQSPIGDEAIKNKAANTYLTVFIIHIILIKRIF